MSKEWESIFTRELGVNPIKINSSLVSGQNRNRLYWTNIPTVTLPEDKKISLQDILDNILDLKLHEKLTFQSERGVENSLGIIIRTQ